MRIRNFLLAAVVLSIAAFAQAPVALPDSVQVLYASNLNAGDSVINLTNAGTQNTGGALTNICASVYTFSPDEQMISCCSCPITPNALLSLSVNADLISNTLTPAHPTSVVIKFVGTSGTTCNGSNIPTANLAAGLQAWRTTLHALPTIPITYGITENPAKPVFAGCDPHPICDVLHTQCCPTDVSGGPDICVGM